MLLYYNLNHSSPANTFIRTFDLLEYLLLLNFMGRPIYICSAYTLR